MRAKAQPRRTSLCRGSVSAVFAPDGGVLDGCSQLGVNSDSLAGGGVARILWKFQLDFMEHIDYNERVSGYQKVYVSIVVFKRGC